MRKIIAHNGHEITTIVNLNDLAVIKPDKQFHSITIHITDPTKKKQFDLFQNELVKTEDLATVIDKFESAAMHFIDDITDPGGSSAAKLLVSLGFSDTGR